MNTQTFAKLLRLATKTDEVTLPDEDILLLMNTEKDGMCNDIVEKNQDIFVQSAFTDLIEGVREYPYPSDMLAQIKYLEANLGPNGELKRLVESKINVRKNLTSEEGIISSFAGLYCYEQRGKQVIVYTGETIPAVVDGLKLTYASYPADWDALDGTDDMSIPHDAERKTLGFPRELHDILLLKVSARWKGSQEKPIPLTEIERSVDGKFARALNTLSLQNLDDSLIANTPSDDGSQY